MNEKIRENREKGGGWEPRKVRRKKDGSKEREVSDMSCKFSNKFQQRAIPFTSSLGVMMHA